MTGAGNAIRLRRTTEADLAVVVDWEGRPDNAVFVVLWAAERHREAIADPAFRHLVIERDGTPVGYVILAGVVGARPVVELLRIVVIDRGRGVGQAAVAAVLDHAFGDLDANGVWLDVVEHNSRARHVYAKLGFREELEADLRAEVGGRLERLVKMTLPRERWSTG